MRFLALAACRHVDAMSRGDALTKELGLAMAGAASYPSEPFFLDAVEREFGIRLPLGT